MAIISIFGGTYCHTDEVVTGVTDKLNYKVITDELISETSNRFGISVERINRTYINGGGPFKRLKHKREKTTAMLRFIIAELIQEDNLIIPSWSGHLIPQTIRHFLKVCTVANYGYRVGRAQQIKSVTEKAAEKIINQDDQERLQWTQFVFNKQPYDEELYDINLAMHSTSVEEAVNLICDHARSDAVKTTERSKKVAEDFILAARVGLELTNAGHDVDTHAEDGHVTLMVKKYVVRLEKYEEELKKIAGKIEGVKEIITRAGQDFSAPSIMPLGDLDMPSKILLVDDEKEFVQTLSERLLTRNLESSVVYDGEQALEFIKEDEPEVIVLDIKMPGIDGIEVLKRIKKDHPHIEVIMLTGHGSDKEEAVANELGAFAYLQKPVNVDDLAQVMKAAYKKIAQSK
jgi:CheY-like chemotaxis protein